MNSEEALVVLDTVLQGEHLNDIQETIFRQVLDGKTYPEIAEIVGYDPNYVKDVGSKLWKLLSTAFNERVTKSNIQSVLRRHAQQIEQSTDLDPALIPSVQPASESQPPLVSQTGVRRLGLAPSAVSSTMQSPVDWGEAIDVSVFYGREPELALLKQWVEVDRCRLIALLGMGGIGKTTLSVKVAEDLQSSFEAVIWRSLRHAPPLSELLASLLQCLSSQTDEPFDRQQSSSTAISRLMDYLRDHRCLLVFDNVETILQQGGYAGRYREGYEDYSELLQRIGETRHQSCLLLTSREKPREFVPLEGATLPVRSLPLQGLSVPDGQKLFQAKGSFSVAQEEEWNLLVEHYAGNPLALKMVAAGIEYLLNGDVSMFLSLLRQGVLVFDDIHNLLDRQFDRLSDSEKELMYWLAIEREPMGVEMLKANLISPISRQTLLETLRSLGQRSLLEKIANCFTQQPVVMEYMTEQFVRQITEEIITHSPVLLHHHALIKAQAKDYVREMQGRLILRPISKRLLEHFGNLPTLEAHLRQLIHTVKSVMRAQNRFSWV
jgi:NB-ARC domain